MANLDDHEDIDFIQEDFEELEEVFAIQKDTLCDSQAQRHRWLLTLT